MRKMIFQFSKKKNDNMVFCSVWNTMLTGYEKNTCFEIFGDEKYGLFSSQKVDGNMIFIDYRKVLVLNFSEMGNTVFFLRQKVGGKMIFADY